MNSRCENAKMFQGLYLLNHYQGSAMNLLRSLHHLETLTCIQKLNLRPKTNILKNCLDKHLTSNTRFRRPPLVAFRNWAYRIALYNREAAKPNRSAISLNSVFYYLLPQRHYLFYNLWKHQKTFGFLVFSRGKTFGFLVFSGGIK